MAAALPLIGITTYGQNEEDRYSLPAPYISAVRRAGGVPVLLPPGETAIETLITRIDRLVLAGGCAGRYGGSSAVPARGENVDFDGGIAP